MTALADIPAGAEVQNGTVGDYGTPSDYNEVVGASTPGRFRSLFFEGPAQGADPRGNTLFGEGYNLNDDLDGPEIASELGFGWVLASYDSDLVDTGTCQVGGSIASPSSPTTKLKAGTVEADVVGHLMFVTGGTGALQCGRVVSFVDGTLIATLSAITPWTTVTNATSTYSIHADTASAKLKYFPVSGDPLDLGSWALGRYSASVTHELTANTHVLRNTNGDAILTVTPTNTTLSSNALTFAGNWVLDSSTGNKIGTATSQKLGFWNATPIVQPASAAQAVLSLDVDVTGADTVDKAALNANLSAIQTLVNRLRTDLISVGIIKGAA